MPDLLAAAKSIIDLIGKATPKSALTILLIDIAAWIAGHLDPAIKSSIDQHPIWFWGSAFACASVLLVRSGERGLRSCREHQAKNKLKRTIKGLPAKEKYILQICRESNTRSSQRPAQDREAISLVERGILQRKATGGVADVFLINQEAWDCIDKDPTLIDTPDAPRPDPTGNEWMGY